MSDFYDVIFGRKEQGQKLEFITNEEGRVIPVGAPGSGGGTSGEGGSSGGRPTEEQMQSEEEFYRQEREKLEEKTKPLLKQRERLMAKDAQLRDDYNATQDRIERNKLVGKMNENVAKIKDIDKRIAGLEAAHTRAIRTHHQTPQQEIDRVSRLYRQARDNFSKAGFTSPNLAKYRALMDKYGKQLQELRAQQG